MSIWGCSSPATYCHPAAAAGFIYCRSQEWALHSPSPTGFVYLEFSWTHVPFVFSSLHPYLPVAIAVLFYLNSYGEVLPLHSSVESATLEPLLDAFSSSSTLGEVAPLLPSPAGSSSSSCLLQFIVHMGECPPPLVELSTWQPLLQVFPAPRFLGRGHHSCLLWLVCLFTVCMRECPSPTLWSSGHPTLFVMCLCFFSCLSIISRFFLFSLGGGQTVQGAMLICPREYHVLLICSPGGLPSRLGAGIWWYGSPSGFSI
jgi:hypothetical protein